jgi:uncharacterized protein
MKTKYLLFLFISLSFTTIANSIPSKPSSFKGISDFAALLSDRELIYLNGVLDSLNSSNDFEIACLIISDLDSYTIKEYSKKIVEKWDIGATKKNKGILILIKPKTTSQKGEIYISVSDNLGNKIPEPIIQRIINNEFISNFKNNNYFKGINDGIFVFNNLGRSEGGFETETFSKESHKGFEGSSTSIFFIGILTLTIISLIFLAGYQNRFGKISNVLIVGVVYIIFGIVLLILRLDIINAVFGFGEMLLDSLMSKGRIKTTYYFLLLNSIVMITAGLILTIKSILTISKENKFS